jgi:fructose-bisphosphate aldolase class I
MSGDKKSPRKSDWPVPFLPTYKFEKELIATARKIASPGRGILAADESTGTIEKRFKEIKVDNTRENRREYRRMLFSTPGLNQHISGAILYDETFYDKTEDGKPLIDLLKAQDIVIGIKVDMGTKRLPGTDNELYTQGMTDLDTRCEKYYKEGARFAKWRAVVEIGRAKPSPLSIHQTAEDLAMYAAICQANGLVPVVEPEILMDGDHPIEICQYWTEKVLAACYKALSVHNVLLEGTLLKPNMVVPGTEFKGRKVSAQDIGAATVKALQRAVPPAVPGITFLSGGQSEEEATENLNAMNAQDLGPRPWSLSFSYGRALQQTVLQVWKGKKENTEAAQKALLVRAKANGMANLGKYAGEAASATAKSGMFEKGYTY